MSQQLISQLERGEWRSTKNLPALAEALGCSVFDLDERYTPDTEDGIIDRVPVISWISAGALAKQNEVSPDMILEHRAMTGLPEGDWIAFRVEGSSMNRISPPDSIIFVNRRERALVPNACYVITDEDGAATYKRYRPDPTRFEPVSTDDSHEPVFPDNTPHIIGRVRRSVIDM